MKKLLALTLLAALPALAYTPKPTVQFDASMLSAFGTPEVGELTPLVQLDWLYGINTQSGITNGTANGGNTDTLGGRLRLQSGTSSTGVAVFQSKRPAKYRAGQGVTARFTTVFSTPVANNLQEIGVGNDTDGYFYGYNTNGAFGINFKSYGTNFWIAQTNWNGDRCLGSGASQFTWNPTNGNVCMVKYPFLGYGAISFWVEDPIAGRFILTHIINYPNTKQTIQISNPNLSFYARNVNSGSTVNQTMYSGSLGIFLSGQRSFSSNAKWATASNMKPVFATETNMISIQCATNFNGQVNRSLIRLNSITLGGVFTGNGQVGSVIFNIRYNPTIGGTPAWNAINGTTNAPGGGSIINGNSITTVDTAGTTVSGGMLEFNVAVAGCGTAASAGNGSSQVFDLTPYDIYIAPGDIVSISAYEPAGSVSTVNAVVALTWTEDI